VVELTEHLVAGILRPGVAQLPDHSTDLYLLPPLPNLFFQRDPAVVIGDRVAIASMATEARRREPMIASWVYRFHPRFATGDDESPVLYSALDSGSGPTD